jgi:alpha-galactosidase
VKFNLSFVGFSTITALVVSAPILAATKALTVSLNAKDGSYSISAESIAGTVLKASPAVRVNGRWIRAQDYPSRELKHSPVVGELGSAEEWSLHYSGLKNAPDLLLRVRNYSTRPFGELQLTATNTTSTSINIESFRLIDASGAQVIQLGGDPSSDRVLSDSFSEDRPAMQLRDLGESENHVHRAVGVQLIYNQKSHQSWFIGALTSDKFLSVLRLHMAGDHSATTHGYEVDSTGTTELLKENSLQESSEEDRVELSLPVAPGAVLSSERMLVSVSDDYHDQLETYAHLIRDLHHARVSAPTPLGWWSWTAYYFGLNQGTALTNAEWLSQHLKQFGYTFVHMDEGYQYARGEYATPDALLFPDGVAAFEHKVIAQGLTPGIWTAPFEVSERSWVFEHHPEWLVHNAKGKPIHIGLVAEGKDHLYALDTTHPGAQEYLRKTYSTLANTWGIRYIKMDFMEDSAIEGYYHAPNTTALEAQRIGIQTVREAVGENVLLDKDGSELLNPVGLIDMGRISQDTGHTFQSSKEAAPGVAARYYMNRNYFIADPDAFTVSKQTVDDQSWHNGQRALTLDEAKVSIALTAVSGGMFEIGDDLPTLGEDPDRVALVENRDLLDMAALGRASTPLDLMSYFAADLQPSIFLLNEEPGQSIVTVFNWTDTSRTHTLTRAELGLDPQGKYSFADIFVPAETTTPMDTAIVLSQPAHSVRMLKIVDTQRAATLPTPAVTVPKTGNAGETLAFAATNSEGSSPVLHMTWDFGDGVQAEGMHAEHAYTHAGSFTVLVHQVGIGGITKDQSFPITITGAVNTKFAPESKRRLIETARPTAND